ncbi:putative phage abortive infection protein [Dyadobacter fermentans]|uniref:Phage abortive infection protein n=1 Tax=Dyadobacter fermentans (strain ATCC 700827 / DSM 18053 / CIP 107007 / KCTC 52180 / NS114) TaxID=471854 RepID=C6W2W2_DYAFD|nr:putative phage abortive infection protein [Dyadobacter fermentans]ACT95675.1 hypothetical protein Dfer_4474 [Dyadobacter fermentans DSM 18053]
MKKSEQSFGLLALVITLIWVISWICIDTFVEVKDQGIFGDKFGAVNALFSGLALAGIIYSLSMQKQELALQRQELTATRNEFKQQNFENVFFNLLRNQQDITNTNIASIDELHTISKIRTVSVKGREFFHFSKRELKRIRQALEREKYEIYDQGYYASIPAIGYATAEEAEKADGHLWPDAQREFAITYYKISKDIWEEYGHSLPIEKAILCYQIYHQKYHYIVGHYFRNILHILNFLETTEHQEASNSGTNDEQVTITYRYAKYGQYIHSQMSGPELMLLYYHCLANSNMMRLVKKYNLLDSLMKRQLISLDHAIEGIFQE